MRKCENAKWNVTVGVVGGAGAEVGSGDSEAADAMETPWNSMVAM